jgi:hypothetical protein
VESIKDKDSHVFDFLVIGLYDHLFIRSIKEETPKKNTTAKKKNNNNNK